MVGIHLQCVPRIQQRLEQRLILEPPRVRGIPGTKGNLQRVLSDHPQLGARSDHYVLAGGWAVELFSGHARPHKDIDIVVLKPEFDVETDNQRPESYFGQISIPKKKFGEMAAIWTSADFPIRGQDNSMVEGENFGIVSIACPEVMAVAKLSGGWGGEPCRDQDIQDVVAIIKNRQNDLLSQDMIRYALRHTIGLPKENVEDVTQAFGRLIADGRQLSWSKAEAMVRGFHTCFRAMVAPQREGKEIQAWG